MTNTMPVLTDAQREKMISDCHDFIAKPDSYQDWFVVMAKITLAALTPDPAAFRYAYLPTVGEEGNWHYVDSEHEASQSSGYVTQKLYTAPPVPALKLPGESEGDPGKLHDVRTRHDFSNGFRFAIEEVKRLNGVAE